MKCCHVIFVCIVSVLLVSGCDKHDDAQIGRLSDDAVVVAFGDSITYGTGAGRKESYPAVLEKLSGYEVINSGISGELSEDGLFRLGFVLDRYEPDLLILCHGGNDMLQKRSVESIKENINGMIETAKDRGIDVILIGVPRPSLLLKTAGLYHDVALHS